MGIYTIAKIDQDYLCLGVSWNSHIFKMLLLWKVYFTIRQRLILVSGVFNPKWTIDQIYPGEKILLLMRCLVLILNLHASWIFTVLTHSNKSPQFSILEYTQVVCQWKRATTEDRLIYMLFVFIWHFVPYFWHIFVYTIKVFHQTLGQTFLWQSSLIV
jgi:hypothetical protein